MNALSSSAIIMLQAMSGTMLLTLIMAGAAAVTRVGAIKRAGLALQEAAHVSDFRDRLPSTVRRVNDNYNHLLEAPTIFYAAVLANIALGNTTSFYAGCSVAYFIMRVAHSIVQATFNRVVVRATFYGLSWIALAPLIVGPLLATLVPVGWAG